jgi:2-polyprenyl-3-methyl-5-hydroxy-6-metoxy-1,4-benzoquinol methylase
MTSVLDVGGGIGSSASWLKLTGRVSRAVVVDLVADDCVPEIDAACSGDLENPNLLDRIAREKGKIDVVLCLDVLEHLRDPGAIVARCHEMLAPGGLIVASIPNVRYHGLVVPLAFAGKFELVDKGILDRTHLRWFVRDTAIRLMTGTGLRLEHVEGFIPGRRWKLLNRLTFGVFEWLFILQYYIRVRRV